MERFTKIFFAAILLLTISSCDKKSCKNVVCASYQTCYNGQCICPDGSEGANCATLSATKYTGSWNVSENCGGGTPPNFTGYNVYIAPVPAGNGYGINTVTITPLFGVGTVYAEILNTDPNNMGTVVYIPQQNLGGIQISASYGNFFTSGISGSQPTMTITLNYTSGGIGYSCQENFYKQP